jgi:signal transduction histidine kinase
MKDTFIAAVSHELRTPLMSTIGALQTIERADVDLGEELRRELVAMARTQAERLAQLVDELLFFSEVETGRLRLSPTRVDFAALVNEAAESALPQAEARGVSLGLVAEDVPELRGDRGRIVQLLGHLIGNAIKFTPAGGSVNVFATAEDGRAVVEIEDTGTGIPADEQQHLFERFFRSTGAVEQAVPGTGIGLSIVKAIVDAHRGSVTIESEEGRGTKVRVELPLA